MKSGFALIVGRSNVGKSTLLNSLAGTKLAAVTPKPQTTRLSIHGVYNDERGQIVFVDTPGIFKLAGSKLSFKLTQQVIDLTKDIDVVIYLVDPTREIGGEERYALSIIEKINAPKIMAINKVDLPKKELKYIEWYTDMADAFNKVVKISALKRKHIKELLDVVFSFLKEGPPIYAGEQTTNISASGWAEEIIREKLFLATEKEVPYNSNVRVLSIEDKDNVIVVKAEIITTKDVYKRMIIGKSGAKIKEIGTLARKELEIALNKKVFLELNVEINPHWIAAF